MGHMGGYRAGVRRRAPIPPARLVAYILLSEYEFYPKTNVGKSHKTLK
jgi:hypothetical protein